LRNYSLQFAKNLSESLEFLYLKRKDDRRAMVNTMTIGRMKNPWAFALHRRMMGFYTWGHEKAINFQGNKRYCLQSCSQETYGSPCLQMDCGEFLNKKASVAEVMGSRLYSWNCSTLGGTGFERPHGMA
jgi:hypothetical protein